MKEPKGWVADMIREGEKALAEMAEPMTPEKRRQRLREVDETIKWMEQQERGRKKN
jgi:hypothetical protein